MDPEADGKPLLFQWREAILTSDLPSTARHVLLTLSTHMDVDGEDGYPSTRTLASETGLSRRTVETHLRDSEAAGWIDREERGEGRGWRGHVYRPRLPRRGEGDSPPRDDGGEAGSPRPPVGGEGASPARDPERGEAVSPRRGRGGETDDVEVGKELPTTSSCTSPGTEGGVRSLRSLTPGRAGSEENPSGGPDAEAAPWGLDDPPDGDGFPSGYLVDGVREVLWLADEPPDGAPEGWDVRAALPDLRRAWDNLGTERLVRVVRGFRLLADAGELPGVDPGEGFTFGLVKRLRGQGVWDDAERAFRDRRDAPGEGGELLDELARGVLEGREAGDA